MCNQDGSSFPSTKLGMMRSIWNRTVLYDPENQIIQKLLHLSKVQTYIIRILGTCHQMLTASLNTDHYKNGYKCVQNVILMDVYFSYCCSLNHSYIYRQFMWQRSVLSITRRERKRISYYRKAVLLLYAIYGAIVHQMLWPLLTDSLYQGFLKFVLVYHYIKFNNFNVPSIILFCI